jgi:hypothetical protein
MTTTNPYDVDLSQFETTYVGFADGFYCFRLHIADKPGLGACMFQMAVSQWLFDQTQGVWHMGNDFPYKDHPKVSFHNPGANDYFVLLNSFPDVVMFEQEFKVLGLTPSMLV